MRRLKTMMKCDCAQSGGESCHVLIRCQPVNGTILCCRALFLRERAADLLGFLFWARLDNDGSAIEVVGRESILGGLKEANPPPPPLSSSFAVEFNPLAHPAWNSLRRRHYQRIPLSSASPRRSAVLCSALKSSPSLSVADSASSDSAARIGSLSQVAGVLGCQWGDEGKGKLVDILAQHFDIVARCQIWISSFEGGDGVDVLLSFDGRLGRRQATAGEGNDVWGWVLGLV
ncbi:unnamed protein product [Linum tenue]|uniref:Adenylosuccinate synthetase n=1 Tax=Linum tenue TaxID=586396 RepID=A0AAV0PCR7_9ROSI|nr:unnamed protein product [Linum tenue]